MSSIFDTSNQQPINVSKNENIVYFLNLMFGIQPQIFYSQPKTFKIYEQIFNLFFFLSEGIELDQTKKGFQVGLQINDEKMTDLSDQQQAQILLQIQEIGPHFLVSQIKEIAFDFLHKLYLKSQQQETPPSFSFQFQENQEKGFKPYYFPQTNYHEKLLYCIYFCVQIVISSFVNLQQLPQEFSAVNQQQITNITPDFSNYQLFFEKFRKYENVILSIFQKL